jgi:NAD(P)-dependent dehydrogenase (short-subunit alcohol dehydrogenase family)
MQCPVLFDDLNFSCLRYPPWLAYGQSKTANVLFAVEAANRWAADGITANAVMPGAIHTNLQRHVDWDEFVAERRALPGWRLKGIEQGAATSVLVAASPLLEGRHRALLRRLQRSTGRRLRGEGGSVLHGVAPYAVDPQNAHRRWEPSFDLLDTAA